MSKQPTVWTAEDAERYAAALAEAAQDPALLQHAAAVEASPAWQRHVGIVRMDFAPPRYSALRVGKFRAHGALGSFDPENRELCLDEREAADLLALPAGEIQVTALHELMHAAQTLSVAARPKPLDMRGQLDLRLFEGSADLATGRLLFEHAPYYGPSISGVHDPNYGPYEAVTEGLLDALSPSGASSNALVFEYALLPYGQQLDWLRSQLKFTAFRLRQRFASELHELTSRDTGFVFQEATDLGLAVEVSEKYRGKFRTRRR